MGAVYGGVGGDLVVLVFLVAAIAVLTGFAVVLVIGIGVTADVVLVLVGSGDSVGVVRIAKAARANSFTGEQRQSDGSCSLGFRQIAGLESSVTMLLQKWEITG